MTFQILRSNYRNFVPSKNILSGKSNSTSQQRPHRESLRPLIRKLLRGHEATKIVFLGLGDFSLKNARVVEVFGCPALIDEISSSTRITVRILTQDPDCVEILKEHGLEAVSQFGAGGFAEVYENSIVVTTFTCASIKQVIADIARPDLIIAAEQGDIFTQTE
ncbi:hypothetical protein F4774DRAFT_408084 [Daldinia eschscholtzii]|nr:hypothetical protein F4774DRAFT_408084 [Daldinia eschscholtzii]